MKKYYLERTDQVQWDEAGSVAVIAHSEQEALEIVEKEFETFKHHELIDEKWIERPYQWKVKPEFTEDWVNEPQVIETIYEVGG